MIFLQLVLLLVGSIPGATLSLGPSATVEVSNFSAGTSDFSIQVSQPGYNFAGVKIQQLVPAVDLVLNSATVNGNVVTSGFSTGTLDGVKTIAPSFETLLLPNFAVGTVVFSVTATGQTGGQTPNQLFMVYLQNQNSYGFTAFNTADSPEPATWALAGVVLLILVALGKKSATS